MLHIALALKEPPEEIISVLENFNTDILHENSSLCKSLKEYSYDIAIIEGGVEEIEPVKACDPRVDVILFGGDASLALEAVRKGASAYFSLPLDVSAFCKTIERIEELNRLRGETFELEKNLSDKYMFEEIIGRNPLMLDIFHFVRRAAPYYMTMAITGETGTGKEILARAIHSVSPVSDKPFIAFNCGGVVEPLFESELFGYKKGAFTGAFKDKPGLFEAAGEGTLFLDEISNMPLTVQPHLLRVLQDGEYRRLGSNRTLKARCRVITASNRDLASEVKKGNFRDDLFFRLTSLTIEIPPLRERKDDIPLLFRHLLNLFNKRTSKGVRGISRAAQSALLSYDWPGNIRELKNIIERAAIVTTESFIRLEDLPESVRRLSSGSIHHATPLDNVIKAHIEKTLRHCNNNQTHAARLLGISRRTLIRKIKKYSID